jgi:hypothetical protein
MSEALAKPDGILPQGLYIEVYYDSNNKEVNRAKVYKN